MSAIFYLAYIASQVVTNLWLSVWTTDALDVVNGTLDQNKMHMRLGVYGALGAVQGTYNTINHVFHSHENIVNSTTVMGRYGDCGCGV